MWLILQRRSKQTRNSFLTSISLLSATDFSALQNNSSKTACIPSLHLFLLWSILLSLHWIWFVKVPNVFSVNKSKHQFGIFLIWPVSFFWHNCLHSSWVSSKTAQPTCFLLIRYSFFLLQGPVFFSSSLTLNSTVL